MLNTRKTIKIIKDSQTLQLQPIPYAEAFDVGDAGLDIAWIDQQIDIIKKKSPIDIDGIGLWDNTPVHKLLMLNTLLKRRNAIDPTQTENLTKEELSSINSGSCNSLGTDSSPYPSPFSSPTAPVRRLEYDVKPLSPRF